MGATGPFECCFTAGIGLNAPGRAPRVPKEVRAWAEETQEREGSSEAVTGWRRAKTSGWTTLASLTCDSHAAPGPRRRKGFPVQKGPLSARLPGGLPWAPCAGLFVPRGFVVRLLAGPPKSEVLGGPTQSEHRGRGGRVEGQGLDLVLSLFSSGCRPHLQTWGPRLGVSVPACHFSVCDFRRSLDLSGPRSPLCKLVTIILASESP